MAKLFQYEPRVFTFSMHGAHNYPFHKEQSDLDIPLKDGTTEKTYLSILSETLPALIKKVQPDFAFFLSGVEILDTDKYSKFRILCYQLSFPYSSFVVSLPCTVCYNGSKKS